MFDLRKTRLLVDRVANIIEGPAPDALNFRPHMLLLAAADYPVRLSTYLQGATALRGAPGIKLKEAEQVEVNYLGEDVVDGLNCVKVALTHTLAAKPIFGSTLWLAADRNYLPVHMETFTYSWSKDIPIGDGHVKAFTEIEPGIWFPSEAVVTCYSGPDLQSERQQKPVWRRRFFFDSISLHPSHPDRFFSDLHIPNGVAVYEVVDANISRSYRQGSPEASKPKRVINSLVLWINVGVLSLVGAFFVVKYWRGHSRADRAAR